MGRKSKAAAMIQADLVESRNSPYLAAVENLTPALQDVVSEIDNLFSDAQAASLTAYWRIGRLITEVKGDPEQYLTAEQQAQHIDGAALLMSIFAPVYTVDQLRGAVNFFEKYPSEAEIVRLLSLRCPDRPRWRLTTSHVQLLAQIPDDQQRAAIEEKCAEEAYTARTLATELQEMRGKQKSSGRTHQAPKGLKQQLHDLLQHQRRWIARSETLWLNEKRDNIYDDIANASPTKFDATTQGYFAEIIENFDKMSDLVADHRAMCAKVQEELNKREEVEDDTEEQDASPRRRSDMTR
ncbi:DUF1016 family protein [bacterium]|nr:DUF1016 family protein [Betaproteobacteria bacterium]NDE17619.1 DUF1016 family protein [bacterium]